MNLERYPLTATPDRTAFEFTSEGPKGSIPKIIRFTRIAEPGIYNLAFGNRIEGSEELDDLAVSNNGDSEKILATVVAAVYRFTRVYPDALIFATGSTPTRTRLYRMGITKYLREAETDFVIYGQRGDTIDVFNAGTAYDAFIVRRKTITFGI